MMIIFSALRIKKKMLFFQQHWIKFLFWLSLFFFSCGNELPKTSESLPFCDVAVSSNRLIFVSTLDGKVTALNFNNGGNIVWSIHPKSEAMLSSSIHKLELSNYGHLVRMIPSLNGGLYKFNGENIEIIPITVDNLLQSSFRYSDDLVISGGKEAHTFGISLRSGNIIYECSMKGCNNVSHLADNGEILVIQRLDQVIRAIEPRTGNERWNFSVAQHNLKLISQCHSLQNIDLKHEIKIIVPDGLVYAVDKKNPSNVLWKYKFNSPVVNAWELIKGKLVQIDLFSNQNLNLDLISPPSIYIGMHDQQLYIQESVTILKKLNEITSDINHKLISNGKTFLNIPWKPISASTNALSLSLQKENQETALDDPNLRQTTALSVLYASPYVDGNGFFLYTEEDFDKIQTSSCKILKENSENRKIEPLKSNENIISESDSTKFKVSEEIDTPVKIVIVSIWFYWKEVLALIFSILFFNFLITRRYLKKKIKEAACSQNKPDISSEENTKVNTNLVNFIKFQEAYGHTPYSSRYLTDFDPIACLGRGGFGVVFEAKNKIDDCHYAIKRIVLPNKQNSRDRVMREVKALAKLDHHHIVRYYNAWTECPPLGWQEEHDKCFADMSSGFLTSNENNTSFAETIPSEYSKSNFNSEASSFPYKKNSCFSESVDFIKDKCSKKDISDSFIVFGEEDENVTNDTQTSMPSNKINLNTLNSQPSKLITSAKFHNDNISKVYLYIQIELCQRNSLKEWLTFNKNRHYENCLSIFEQILQAVEYVHLHGLIHRDLKPSNIFFSLDNQIKVGDFGLVTGTTEEEDEINTSFVETLTSNSHNEKHTGNIGTYLYMSQELLGGKFYNYKVDIYSLGLILFELLIPFNTQMERIHILQNIKADKFPDAFKKKFEDEYKLIRLMLSPSPNERPTTYGIRARLPLKQEPVKEEWHFELPKRKRTTSITSINQNSTNTD